MFSVSLSLTESKIFCPLPTLPVFSHLIYCQCHLVEEAPPKQSALSHPLCGLPMPLCSRGQDSLSLLCVLCLPLFGLLPHFAEVGVNGRQIIWYLAFLKTPVFSSYTWLIVWPVRMGIVFLQNINFDPLSSSLHYDWWKFKIIMIFHLLLPISSCLEAYRIFSWFPLF